MNADARRHPTVETPAAPATAPAEHPVPAHHPLHHKTPDPTPPAAAEPCVEEPGEMAGAAVREAVDRANSHAVGLAAQEERAPAAVVASAGTPSVDERDEL